MATTLTSPDLAGRAAELDELTAALTAASEGQSVAVLLGGEAGVGKTRLVAEFADVATDGGARVIVGQCVELGGDGPPYAPVAGALRHLVEQLGVEQLLDLAGPGRDALAGLLPELGGGPGESSDGRGRLFEVVTVLLERMSADRPLLGLTAREREVLRLVSAGRSNRQIGEELFITAKTASVHVSNILAKLGVSGRGEAAALAHRARLFDDEDARRPA